MHRSSPLRPPSSLRASLGAWLILLQLQLAAGAGLLGFGAGAAPELLRRYWGRGRL